MFRRRKSDDELIELMRGELAAARAEMRASIAGVNAQLDGRLSHEIEQRERVAPMLVEGLERVRSEMSSRDLDLLRALKRVATACEMLGDHLQLERTERGALVDAIAQLTMQLAADNRPVIVPPPAPTVIGGSVTPAAPAARPDLSALEDDAPLVIDLRDHTHEVIRQTGVEVHCRFGDRWVDGFEIHEIVESPTAVRYRLRRCSDGYVLPTLFSEGEVRGFTRTAVHTEASPIGTGGSTAW